MTASRFQSERPFLASALRDELAREGALELPALGASMGQAVPGGSVLRVAPLAHAVLPGELIAFVPESGPLLCCHRAIETRADGAVRMKGDRHDLPDGFVGAEQIIGVVRDVMKPSLLQRTLRRAASMFGHS